MGRRLFVRGREVKRNVASPRCFTQTRSPNGSRVQSHQASRPTDVIIAPISGSGDPIIAAITLGVSMALEQSNKLFSLRYNRRSYGPTERPTMQFCTAKSKKSNVILPRWRGAIKMLWSDLVLTRSTRCICPPKVSGPTTPLNKTSKLVVSHPWQPTSLMSQLLDWSRIFHNIP